MTTSVEAWIENTNLWNYDDQTCG